MAKQTKKTNKTNKTNNKGKNGALIGAAAVLCAAAVVFAALQNIGKIGGGSAPNEQTQVVSEGESLVIPVGDITDKASFYPVEVDGVEMEVLAIKDSQGNIRTAFNTCQVCYGSGYGYYVQDGDELVCQNCGNRFGADQVEVQSGGCNPVPIFEDYKTVTDDSIEISYDFLKQAEGIFAAWK